MIILDNKHISDFGFYIEPGFEDPITPVFEQKTLAIPGRAGLWDFGTEIRGKQFAFTLKMINRYHDDMQQAYNKLVAFLFDELGRPRPIKLVREYELDKFYTVKVMEQMLPERLFDESSLILPFVAYDPYKYSNIYADEITWGSEKITFESDFILGHESTGGSLNITGPQVINITVSGLAVQPFIEIEGTADDLKMSANGHAFSLPNFNNENWIIDFGKYLVFRNGLETMIEIRDFHLMPGDNQIEISGSNININLRIKFRDKYL